MNKNKIVQVQCTKEAKRLLKRFLKRNPEWKQFHFVSEAIEEYIYKHEIDSVSKTDEKVKQSESPSGV